MPLELALTTEEKALLHASPQTEAGNPAVIDGPVLFTVTAGDVTLEANDPTSMWVVSGAIGDSTVKVSCDADLGQGVVTVEDLVTVHVTNAMAESLALTSDLPILK